MAQIHYKNISPVTQHSRQGHRIPSPLKNLIPHLSKILTCVNPKSLLNKEIVRGGVIWVKNINDCKIDATKNVGWRAELFRVS